MSILSGSIDQIRFQNPDDGYTVAVVKYKCDNNTNYNTLVGILPEIAVDCEVEVEGEWVMDPKFGTQFKVTKVISMLPSTKEGLIRYLSSRMFRGVGKRTAMKILEMFGDDTPYIIEHNPYSLTKVNNISERKALKIHENWCRHSEVNHIMVFLQKCGVSAAYAVRIYKKWENQSIVKIKKNPYLLADEIEGIGFKKADAIATNMGYKKDDPRRLKSGIAYTLSQLANAGHVYANFDQLTKEGMVLLDANEEQVMLSIDEMIEEKTVVFENNAIYLPLYYNAERSVAQHLSSLYMYQNKRSVKFDLNEIERMTKVKFDEVQINAIKTALDSKVMVMTGGPGTGKTTTTMGIIAAFKNCQHDVLLAAPTGRAAKRLAEVTGMEAKTIHRLLEFQPGGGFKKNENNPLGGNALIVDEASMIDLLLMSSLCKAIPPHMRLILVGDVDQLPSVGAGYVLADIINSRAFPVVRLERVFRQALQSNIVRSAHRINLGDMPDIRNVNGTDFFFIETKSSEEAANLIKDLVNKRLPKAYNVPQTDIQVLTPSHKGLTGTDNLNLMLQKTLNPDGKFLMVGTRILRVGDKVMQTRNNYDKGVFNGDVGVVTWVDDDEGMMVAKFGGGNVPYKETEVDELTLAYAVTIHKSQGSEYPIVIIPLLMDNYIMLKRNLIYTAVTRSKKICILIGSKRALAMAVHNEDDRKRNTKLAERLSLKSP